jgi:hypothetical protein
MLGGYGTFSITFSSTFASPQSMQVDFTKNTVDKDEKYKKQNATSYNIVKFQYIYNTSI